MRKLAELTEKYRKIIIWGVIAVTLVMLYGFRYLKIESDIAKWIRSDVPEVKSLNYISEHFGGKDLALVGVESDSLFSLKGFKLLAELHDSFEVINGVSDITSLMNILDIRSTEEGIDIRNLIDRYNLPQSSDSIAKLRAYILSRDIYRGRVVSENGKVTLFLIRLSKDAEKPEVASRIRTAAENITAKYSIPVKLYFSGTPLLLKTINSSILNDMFKLVPIVILVVVLVLYMGIRSTWGVVLSLWSVIAASVWSIGLMGYTGIPLSVVSNTMPVLLIAIGSAYGIHVLSRYVRWLSSGIEIYEAVKRAQIEVFIPVLFAALTTMASFFSFTGSYVISISHFGIFTGIGIVFAVLLSLFFIPAMLYGINYRVIGREKEDIREVWYERIMENVGMFIERRVFLTIVVGISILSFGIAGFTKLKTTSNLLYYFPRKSEVRKSAEFLRKNFKGDIPVYILVKGDLKEPAVLQQMLDFEKFMRKRGDVGFPNSIADLIVSTNEASFGYRGLPETRNQVEDLSFMLEGRPILKQLVNDNYTEGIINANALMSAYGPLKEYLKNRFSRELTFVNVDTLSPESSVYNYLLSRTVWRIYEDAKFRNIKVDTSRIKEVLLSSFKEPFVFSSNDISSLLEKIMSFMEDEGIPVTRESLKNMAPFIVDSTDTLLLEGYLANIIPSELKKEDPKIVKYIAEGILSIRADFVRSRKIENTCSKLYSVLACDAVSDSEFIKDVKGDIYTFFKKHVAVPSHIAGTSPDIKIDAVYSGLLPVEKRINDNIMKSQIKSMIIALLVVLSLVSLDAGSLLGGIIATLTILLVISINFGIMGFLGINLDSGTMLVASIAIGIGIDYAIHFISHLKHEVKSGLGIEDGVKRTIVEKGRAILINATTVGFGFLVLVLGNLIPIRNFGWLLFITMLTSAFLSLTFLPALILLLKKPFYRIMSGKKGGV